jgi:oligoendopeptidase F
VFDSPLSLAETASIFNEMLLSDRIQKFLNKKEKIEFLNKKLEDIFATIFRQIQYVNFEKIVHERILN